MWFWYTLNFENHSSRAVACSLMVVPQGDVWPCMEPFLVVTNGGGVLLAFGGQRPGMPLNILQCADRPPQTKSMLRRQRCWGWETAPGQSRAPFSLSSLGSSVSCEWSNNTHPYCWWFYLACSLQHLTNPRNWTYYFLTSLRSSPVYSATAQSILTHVPPKKILLIFHFEFVLWNQTIGY